MKKLITIIVAVSIVLTLTACSMPELPFMKKKEEPAPPPPTLEETYGATAIDLMSDAYDGDGNLYSGFYTTMSFTTVNTGESKTWDVETEDLYKVNEFADAHKLWTASVTTEGTRASSVEDTYYLGSKGKVYRQVNYGGWTSYDRDKNPTVYNHNLSQVENCDMEENGTGVKVTCDYVPVLSDPIGYDILYTLLPYNFTPSVCHVTAYFDSEKKLEYMTIDTEVKDQGKLEGYDSCTFTSMNTLFKYIDKQTEDEDPAKLVYPENKVYDIATPTEYAQVEFTNVPKRLSLKNDPDSAVTISDSSKQGTVEKEEPTTSPSDVESGNTNTVSDSAVDAQNESNNDPAQQVQQDQSSDNGAENEGANKSYGVDINPPK